MAQSEVSADNAASKPRSMLLLERNFGLLGVVVFGVVCVGLSSAGLLPFSTVAGLWPGSNLTGIIAVGLLMCLLHALTYAFIGSAAPRSGADYILSSRVLSAPLGFAASFLLVVFSGLTAGSLIAFLQKAISPVLLQTAGLLLNSSSVLGVATTLGQPGTIVVVGTVFLVIVFVLSILDSKTIQRILLAGFLLTVAAWAIILIRLGTASPNLFGPAWDQFMGASSYAGQVELAQSLGMRTNSTPGVLALAGLAVGFWIFYGYHTPTYLAGEVKRPESTLLRGSLISLLLTGLILLVASLLMNRLTSPEWLSAESYLYLQNFGQAMPWITFYAAVLKPGIFLMGVVILAWIFSMLNLVQTYFLFSSRIILAYVDDGLAPEVFGFVHPTLKSPLVAILAVGILAGIGLADSAQGGGLVSQMNFGLYTAVAQLPPVLAIAFLPFLRKDWYAKMPTIVRRKILGIPVITITGILTAAALVWLAVSSILYRGLGQMNLMTVIILAVIFGWGIGWYYVRRSLMRRQGTPIDDHFQSLES